MGGGGGGSATKVRNWNTFSRHSSFAKSENARRKYQKLFVVFIIDGAEEILGICRQ